MPFAFICLVSVLTVSTPNLSASQTAQTPQTPQAPQAPQPPQAPTPPADTSSATQSASPELVGKMVDELKVTPKQAEGGAGALLALAKQRLKPEEFKQVADAIPGTDGLLSTASALASSSGAGGMAGMAGMAKGAAGLASLAGTFNQLGLSPDMATKMVPVLTNFVQSKGASQAASLLAGALK